MTGSHLFTLGLFQKNFNSTSRVTGPAINMGCTKGRASTTRMFNYCKQRSQTPSLCINQFVTTYNKSLYSSQPTSVNLKVYLTNKHYVLDNITNKNIDIINEEIVDIIHNGTDITNKNIDIINEDTDIINEDIEFFQSVIDNEFLPELSDIYLRENKSEEWFDNSDV